MVRQIVAGESDLEIVGELEDMTQRRLLCERRPQVVVVGLEADQVTRDLDLPGTVAAVLDQLPGSRVLGLAPDGRSGFLYRLRPEKSPIGELSPEVLIATMREIGRPR
jgi:hypothetical protein